MSDDVVVKAIDKLIEAVNAPRTIVKDSKGVPIMSVRASELDRETHDRLFDSDYSHLERPE